MGAGGGTPCNVTPVAVVLMLTCFLMVGALYTMGLGLEMLLMLPLREERGDAKAASLLEGERADDRGGWHDASRRSMKLSL